MQPEETALTIAVYGGSAVREGGADYALAYQLGRLLAEAGLTVLSGGYIGCMEAVSRGACDAGGEAIGLTVPLFEKRGISPNSWLSRRIPCQDLFDRLARFTTLARGFVALPGGVGTLGEVAVTRNLLQVGAIRRRPLVLIGGGWSRVFQAMAANLYIGPGDVGLVRLVETAEEAIEILQRHLNEGSE